MSSIAYEVEVLDDRESFNKVVNHLKAVIEILGDVADYSNLADILNEFIEQERLKVDQISPILSTVLIDKFNYEAQSYNLESNVDKFQIIAKEIAKWNAVDIVMAYYHPELGTKAINPKRLKHWQALQSLKRNELITIYAGTVKNEISDKLKHQVMEKCIALLKGEKISTPSVLLKGRYKLKVLKKEPKERVEKVPSQKEAAREEKVAKKAEVKKAPTGQRRMTPLYSIPVTNELFHNGNVEAWKKIIESYTTKYTDLDVSIFYEGERIHDINTLFKWGKVKHGSAILIAVVGVIIKDVAKLRRYLNQGASPMFEAFLKFPVGHVLKLF